MAPEPRIEAQAEVTTGDRPLQRMVLSDTCKRSCAPAAQDEKKWYHGDRLVFCLGRRRAFYLSGKYALWSKTLCRSHNRTCQPGSKR